MCRLAWRGAHERGVRGLLELERPGLRVRARALELRLSARGRRSSSRDERLQFAGLLAIRVLGSVTMKLLGIARSAALVLFEVLRGNEPASLRMIVGYSISLGAFAVYSRLKMKEKQR